MIFAIYRGVPDGVDNGPGQFTKGRLYVADAEVDDKVVVDMERLFLRDDNGTEVCIEPEHGRFEYPEEVYAVVVKEVGARTPGEVVVIDGADDEGEFLSVKGMGYIRQANLQLLDSTMLKPGMMAFNRAAGKWERVRVVNECMQIKVEGSDEMRNCEDFVLAVSDGELATVPLLRCLDDSGCDNIKEGSIYRVTGLEDGKLVVEDDNGNENSFEPERFKFI